MNNIAEKSNATQEVADTLTSQALHLHMHLTAFSSYINCRELENEHRSPGDKPRNNSHSRRASRKIIGNTVASAVFDGVHLSMTMTVIRSNQHDTVYLVFYCLFKLDVLNSNPQVLMQTPVARDLAPDSKSDILLLNYLVKYI